MRHIWSLDDIKPGVCAVLMAEEPPFVIRPFVMSSDRRFSQYPGKTLDEKRMAFRRLWMDENAAIKKDIGCRRVVLARTDQTAAIIGPFTPRALATWLTSINARKVE